MALRNGCELRTALHLSLFHLRALASPGEPPRTPVREAVGGAPLLSLGPWAKRVLEYVLMVVVGDASVSSFSRSVGRRASESQHSLQSTLRLNLWILSMASRLKGPGYWANEGTAPCESDQAVLGDRSSKWGTEQDQRGMARMGKKQELRRQFKFLSITGYATILSCSWEFAMM